MGNRESGIGNREWGRKVSIHSAITQKLTADSLQLTANMRNAI
ncbi:hypothetical protein [Moorena sp. SIO3H5]|nr:hypothetical protein [Moorena sp. SIO3H5]